MRNDYSNWIKGTNQNRNNPADWNGTNPECIYEECSNEIEFMDEYCTTHQRCFDCGDRSCDCEFLILQYNRNRPYTEHINSLNEIE